MLRPLQTLSTAAYGMLKEVIAEVSHGWMNECFDLAAHFIHFQSTVQC